METEAQKRERIYREVQREYWLEDAKRHVQEYLEYKGLDMGDFEGEFDYAQLAGRFEDCQDCNVAENDTWDAVVEEYIADNNIDIDAVPEYYEVSFKVEGRFRTTVKAGTPQKAKEAALRELMEADFGPLEDIESKFVHAVDELDQYYYE